MLTTSQISSRQAAPSLSLSVRRRGYLARLCLQYLTLRCCLRRCRAVSARQSKGELGELTDPALDLDGAADVVADREAKPGTLVGRLGREMSPTPSSFALDAPDLPSRGAKPMENCGCRRVIAYSARGSFRSTDVNLTIPIGSFQSKFGPDTFVVIEKWESPEAPRAHVTSPHMAAYAAKTRDMIASRVIRVLQPGEGRRDWRPNAPGSAGGRSRYCHDLSYATGYLIVCPSGWSLGNRNRLCPQRCTADHLLRASIVLLAIERTGPRLRRRYRMSPCFDDRTGDIISVLPLCTSLEKQAGRGDRRL